MYELGEPNKPDWKEYEPERNVFPGIVDWDPDSPFRAGSDFSTKELFDGHGGIVGLEVKRSMSTYQCVCVCVCVCALIMCVVAIHCACDLVATHTLYAHQRTYIVYM